MQPHVHLAYAPRGAGVASALFCVTAGEHVYGWYTGARDHGCEAAFFALEHYYSTHATTFCRSLANDVYGAWVLDYAPVVTDIRCPVPDAVCHELERLQEAFVREWLFYPAEPGDAPAAAAYRDLGLPVGPVNVRAEQLSRFDQSQPTWVYASPGIDLNIVATLRTSWPLDDREPPAPA
jgi:hypothetical protein